MGQVKIRIFSLFLISLLLIPQKSFIIKGCGGWYEESYFERAMFIPEMIETERFDPFFLSSDDYYSPYNESFNSRKQAVYKSKKEYNLDEWESYFLKLIPRDELIEIVYSLPEEAIDSFQTVHLKAIEKIPTSTQKNIGIFKIKEGAQYLRLAKQIEKALYVNPWSNEEYNEYHLEGLRTRTINKFYKLKDKELKMRYGFQYVKLSYALKEYENGIQFTNNEYPYTEDDGSMFYRTHGYKAACHVKLKQFSKANIWYAKLYNIGETYKFEAFESFHPQSEEEWNETLSLAESDKERELLWHLLGVYVDPLRGINEIKKLNPESEYLPLLLVRAVQIIESQKIKNNDYPNDYGYDELRQFTPDSYYSWTSITRENTKELITIIRELIPYRIDDESLWWLSGAYLHWMNNDLEKSNEWTKEASALAKRNHAVLLQVKINNLLNKLSSIETLRETDELEIHELILDMDSLGRGVSRDDNAIKYVLHSLSIKYSLMDDPLMAELTKSNKHNYYDTESKIDEMISFMLSSSPNAFRRYLINHYSLSLANLYEVKATARIYAGKFIEANEIFKENKNAGKTELLGNPFNDRKVDCHDCDHDLPQRVKYTKESFVEKMIELIQKASDINNKDDRAINYFLFANGLYNMSYYGNARLVSTSAISWKFDVSDNDDKHQNYIEDSYYDCSRAAYYYGEALKLSQNKEFSAKCIWMIAKCEHNEWLNTSFNYNDKIDFVAGEYFKQFKLNYSDTKYYSEVINECGYFCQYVYPSEASCIKNKEY